MIIGLLLLVAIGVIIAVVSFFSSVEDAGWKNNQSQHQGGIERNLRDLREQLFTLEIDIKKTNRVTTGLRDDIQNLQSKTLPDIAQILTAQEATLLEDESLDASTLASRLQDAQNKIRVLIVENKNLSSKISTLTSEIEVLTDERSKQDKLVDELKNRELRIHEQLKALQLDFEGLRAGLKEATESKLQMKENLFKLKVISADNEKELAKLRVENKELLDSLTYERNS
tara:strand:- start:619 stop:1302 length:684 start_codon:yes stop_codon:yes gene_type:complete